MALPQVYEQVCVTGMPNSTQGRGRMLCRLRDQTYAIVYAFLNGANSEIRVSIGTGVGHPWGEEVVATAPGSNLLYPCIAVDSRDNLHVCYEDNTANRVYYVKRSHLTGVWGAPVDVAESGSCASPVLAVGPDDRVSVVWVQVLGMLARCRLRQVSYSGVWTDIEVMDNPAPAHDGHALPSIAYDTHGNLHVVTQSKGYGVNHTLTQIMYMRRNADGSYEAQIQVTDVLANETYASIVVDMADRIHLAWKYMLVGIALCYTVKQLSDTGFPAVVDLGSVVQPYHHSLAASQDLALHCASMNQQALVNWGVYIANRHITDNQWWALHRTDSTNPPTASLALTADPNHPNLLWAMFPRVDGCHTNIPVKGTAMAFCDNTALAVYFHTFSGCGYYNCTACWEACIDDTLAWTNATQVDDHPSIRTLPATAISDNSVVLNGDVVDDQGECCDVCFEYGPTSAYGMTTEWQSGMRTGAGFSSAISGLAQGAIHHFRVKARWGGETFYGDDVIVTTRMPEAVLRTAVTSIPIPLL